MSACGQMEEDSAAEEMGAPNRDAEQKSVSKVVRVLTVLAYLLSVSLAAILLSVYYVWVWKSPTLMPLNETLASALRADHAGDILQTTVYYGGSNTTVSESIAQVTANYTEGLQNTTEDGAGVERSMANTTLASFSITTSHNTSEDDGGVT